MVDKDPTTYTYLTYIWVAILSMAGGLVAFIRRLNHAKKPLPLHRLAVGLLGELIISGFAGVITFYLCEYWDLSQLLTAVLVAVSGHMGGNAIDKFTKMWDAFAETKSFKD